MPLRHDIVGVFEAIPDRIEVSGSGPTWRVTGGSFEAVLAYARQAFGDPVVLDRQDRRRWWPRVTLTVTKDPALAAVAPPLETLAQQQASEQPEPDATQPRELQPPAYVEPEPRSARPEPAVGLARLEDMFAYQEEVRAARTEHRVPPQRRRS
jgi:hypothetical protein